MKMRNLKALGFAAAATLTALPATAQSILGDLPIIGQPQPGGIGFQPAATSLASRE